ncbi:hypothetical protein Q3G72_032679 [Acer saccharum]|nr:hypothetical protein Q3G72_032679 [Acer saccharum]
MSYGGRQVFFHEIHAINHNNNSSFKLPTFSKDDWALGQNDLGYDKELDEASEEGEVRSPTTSNKGSSSDNSRQDRNDKGCDPLDNDRNANQNRLRSVIVAKDNGAEGHRDYHRKSNKSYKDHCTKSRSHSHKIKGRFGLQGSTGQPTFSKDNWASGQNDLGYDKELGEASEEGEVRIPTTSNKVSSFDNSRKDRQVAHFEDLAVNMQNAQGLNLCVDLNGNGRGCDSLDNDRNANQNRLRSVIVAKDNGAEGHRDYHRKSNKSYKDHCTKSRSYSHKIKGDLPRVEGS